MLRPGSGLPKARGRGSEAEEKPSGHPGVIGGGPWGEREKGTEEDSCPARERAPEGAPTIEDPSCRAPLKTGPGGGLEKPRAPPSREETEEGEVGAPPGAPVLVLLGVPNGDGTSAEVPLEEGISVDKPGVRGGGASAQRVLV